MRRYICIYRYIDLFVASLVMFNKHTHTHKRTERNKGEKKREKQKGKV